jgi:transcriptional regulator with XRE-family HTH domain
LTSAGLSQAVLARLIGRSESWLSQVERGKRGVDSHAVLTRMAAVLRVQVEELTGPDERARRKGSACTSLRRRSSGP